MSIYKPVTQYTRNALALGGSMLSNVGGQISNKIGGGGSLLGRVGNRVAHTAVNVAGNEITRRVANPMMNAAQAVDKKLAEIRRKGLKLLGLNAFDNFNPSDDAMSLAGGLSMWDMLDIHARTNGDDLSRKNFYILEINDRSRASPVINGEKYSQFNLLTTSLSFNSFDIQGESIPIGSVELDKLGSNAKTVLNLTCYDDKWGTIKQWAALKSQVMTGSDGTFLPPVYYCFEVRIVFGTNIPDPKFYEQIYLMRVQTMPHELTRQENGLEELNLTFSQVDTFMPTFVL